ncbi:anti-sigma factor [Solimonas terrae]|uniref:Anti-sigma K factor RskA C-terminal domain-containing protein n=1 Tax=Solimonas terrae TaxID=1396819 RepID=A0A6M2BW48_9GAMM|nr:anti-sigma factor [Solimonas terrae]NGY06560.1 hypothetical protein [Solimonas terrae]
MKYDNARLTQMLAAEYALGTLVGRARQRFARLLQTRADLRRELQFWEARFAPLLASSKPVPPREVVWAEIEARIRRSTVTPIQPPVAPRGLWLWQTWAVAASAALVALSLQLYRYTQAPVAIAPPVAVAEPPAPYVSMLQAKGSDALWLVSVNAQKRDISIVAQGDYSLDAQRESLELWMIGDDGKPRSLGLLPLHGRGHLQMPASVPMPAKPVLAISREPHGGSPTGSPTGPVISSGPLLSL